MSRIFWILISAFNEIAFVPIMYITTVYFAIPYMTGDLLSFPMWYIALFIAIFLLASGFCVCICFKSILTTISMFHKNRGNI